MTLTNKKVECEKLLVHAAPEGEIEIAVAGVWADVLEVDHVGRHDHFFELGGDSLQAISVFSILQDLFHVRLPLRELGSSLENPTIAATARIIEAVGAANHVDVVATARIINEISSLPEQEAQAKLLEKEGLTK